MEEITIDSFKGIAPKYGTNLPVGFAESAINCSLYKGKLTPLAKNTLVQAETHHYNSFAYHCAAWVYGNNRFYCPWKIGVLDLLIYKDDSGYLKKGVSWIITKTDISFDNASKEIRSAAGDFNVPSLGAGITFTVSGSTSNNGTFTVSTTVATTATVITVQEAVVTEAAGDTVTIKVCKEDYLGQTRQGAPTLVAGTVPVSNQLGLWVEKAGQFGAETSINALTEFNSKLYGATELRAKLFEWDEVNFAWLEKASKLGAELGIHSLAVFNNKLYGGCYGGLGTARLYEWDNISAWTLKAASPATSSCAHCMTVFNGKLYMGSVADGALYEWNDVDTWVQVAPQLGAATQILSLAVFNGKLYGATNIIGALYEWNGVNAWVQKAPLLAAETEIRALCVFNSKLYGGTYPHGKLYEWNGTNAWVEKAAQIGSETAIESLVVFNTGLYGGTGPTGKLVQWNGTDSWILRAAQLGAETTIYSLAVHDGVLYGGTGAHGKLYAFQPSETSYTYQYLFTLTRNIGGHIDESGPSTVSAKLTMVVGQTATVTRPAWAGLGASTYVTHWNLYRLSNATGAWMLVATIPFATTSYVDAIVDADLGETPPSYYTSDQENEIIWDIPLRNLDGITTEPAYGVIFGWKGSTLYWSEPGYPDAWVAFYNMNFLAAIKNCLPISTALAVLTAKGPFRVDGNHPETLQQSTLLSNDPAMSVLGCCKTKFGVLYLSDSGIALFDLSGTKIVTDQGFGEDWFKANVSPTGAVMIEVDNIGYLFHSGGGLVVDFRPETPIATTLSEVIYGVYRKEDDDDLYVMDAAGIQKFGTAVGTKAMIWKSGELLGDHPEEKTFIETEIMGPAVAIDVTNYVDGASSTAATLAMSTTRNKRLGFLDEKAVGRAAQIQIYKAAHTTLTPLELEITEVIIRYTR